MPQRALPTSLQPTRDRHVKLTYCSLVLHPQWFADLGNADAAREAARLLAEAAPAGGRNYEQAIRYLNQARPCACLNMCVVWCRY